MKRFIKRSAIFITAPLLISATALSSSATSQLAGWVTICDDQGKIYRCKTGGTPELLYSIPNAGSNFAWQSVWSADGKYIYFQARNSGGIWVMDNDGKSPKRLCDATLPQQNTGDYTQKLDAYRPDPDYAFYVDGNKFYKISRLTGEMTLIHTDTRSYWGESQISADGKRMVARTSNQLYKIDVGGTSTLISSICASSLSPDGKYITHDQSATKTDILLWDDLSIYKTILPPSGARFDNTKFAVNSNDFVAYYLESGTAAAGVFQVSTGTHFQIGNISAHYPSLWVGDLPSPSAVKRADAVINAVNISAQNRNAGRLAVSLSLPAYAERPEVSIVTVSGKIIHRVKAAAGERLCLEIPGIKRGFLLVNVSFGDKTFSQKVLIVR